MGINISSNYIPAININIGISVSGTLSINTNSLYDVTNYQTVNITKPEDLLETRLITPSQITSYSDDSLTYLAPGTFYSTGIKAANFPSCTTIGSSVFDSCRSLTTVNFPSCTSIGSYAFYTCLNLTSVNFPSCTTIGSYAFWMCSSLSIVNFPSCTSIGNYAFYSCASLTSVNFPVCTSIGSYAFQNCFSLTLVSLPMCNNISTSTFYKCYNLLSLYLLGSSLCSLTTLNAFYSTPISDYTTSTGGVYGSIYVPASLYSSYIAATNWVTYSSRFVSV